MAMDCVSSHSESIVVIPTVDKAYRLLQSNAKLDYKEQEGHYLDSYRNLVLNKATQRATNRLLSETRHHLARELFTPNNSYLDFLASSLPDKKQQEKFISYCLKQGNNTDDDKLFF